MSTLNTLIARAIPFIPRVIVQKMSRRYIAGSSITHATDRLKHLNALGFLTTVDVLGETATSLKQARQMADEYIHLLESIHRDRLQGNVSIKPTSLGLLLNLAECERLMLEVIEAAQTYESFVRIDMEDSSCTQLEIDMFKRLRQRYGNVGLVLQSYLKRTDSDLASLLAINSNLRLCKGIYIEASHLLVDNASIDRRAINAPFLRHVEQCFAKRSFVGIATHDADLIQGVIALADRMDIPNTQFEFQMLLGVCEPLRNQLKVQGYSIRIYVPYGTDWYGYSTRRIKENPQIAGYLIREMLKS